jgi:hypothetical protein
MNTILNHYSDTNPIPTQAGLVLSDRWQQGSGLPPPLEITGVAPWALPLHIPNPNPSPAYPPVRIDHPSRGPIVAGIGIAHGSQAKNPSSGSRYGLNSSTMTSMPMSSMPKTNLPTSQVVITLSPNP